MRLILAIIAAAALAWTGWWFFIATAKERAIEGWLAERRAAGWVAEAEAIDVRGFPYRVDTTIRGLELANPEAGWSWTAPDFTFLTLAYKPNHLIAEWPRVQSFATPLESAEIRSRTMRGSVVVEPNPRLGLVRSTIELGDVEIVGASGWQLGLAEGMLSTRRAEGEGAPPFAYDVALDAEGLAPPENLLSAFDRPGMLAPLIDTARLRVRAAFDRPWDRPAIEGEPPRLEALEIEDMAFAWGRLDLRGRGRVAADANGLAEGHVDLRARNWRQMIELAEKVGALPSGLAGALQSGLGLIARLGGDRNTLEIPLEFANGATRLGPVPIGPAPRLNDG